MGRMPPLVCLWPGLAQLWLRGSWSGLALACGFAALVNFLVAATLVWTGWLSSGLLLGGWVAALLVWCVSAWGGVPAVPTEDSPPPVAELVGGSQDLLATVYTQYLQGNWFEAEVLLQQMLRVNGRDAEALLLLATLQRHTQRCSEAAETLDRLERIDEGLRWQMEIAAERAHLARLAAEAEELADDEPAETEQPAPPAEKDRAAAA